MKIKLAVIVLTIIIMSGFMLTGKQFTEVQSVFINEVRSWDVDVTRDGYYGSDYIELYNSSKENISLHGWYISDDETNLKKCQITDVEIPAKDYVLLFANGKQDSGSSLNFKINPEGEKILLSDGEGNLVDSIWVPKQELGTVYARISDGAENWAIMESSILSSNEGKKILPARNLDEPQFSHESGFYEDSFLLTLECNPGEIIYYTLDGSEPTIESNVYKDGILIENISDQPNIINAVRNIRKDWSGYGPDPTPVDKAVVVRAVSYTDEQHASEVVTKTYFVDLEEYKNKNVLSVVADFDELFGDNGIFVTGKAYDALYIQGKYDENVQANFSQSGRRWEAQGNIQIIQNGNEITNQEIGLRVQGKSSRDSKKKRIGFYAREEYSESKYIEGLVLDGMKAHSYVTNHQNCNTILQDLVKDRNVSTQSGIAIDIFLNGEYYYSGYMVEKYNKYYLNDNYGINPENIMLVKEKEVSEGPSESRLIYDELIYWIMENDFSEQQIYDILLEKIDIQSYIDFIAINAYVGNIDVTDIKNYLVWRTIEKDSTELSDQKWRWMLYDMDCISWVDAEEYGVEHISQINSFIFGVGETGASLNEHPIFKAVKRNDNFCKQFALTFMDLVNVNFSVETVEKEFRKWGMTLEEYNGFFKERSEYIVPYMAEEFGLTGTLENVTLKVNDAEGGIIKLNTTTPDVLNGSWTGQYYTDYPVTATAVPADGYEFVGWSGSVVSDDVTIEAEVVAGGIVLEAAFRKTAE